MPQCTRCPFEGDDSDFANVSKIGTGTCKRCKARYNEDWYQRNKSTHIENVSRNNNRYGSKYRKVRRDPKKVRSQRLQKISKGTCTTCSRKAEPGRVRCLVCLQRDRSRDARNRKDPSKLPQTVLADCKESDRKRGRSNDLTIESVRSLLSQACAYCGETYLRMTLDRVDNSGGHTQDNVNPSCLRCNYLRGSMPYEAWLLLLPGIKEARTKGLFGSWTGRARKQCPPSSEEERRPPKTGLCVGSNPTGGPMV